MIYTFTYQRALNFGASLQAYALAKFLNDNDLSTQVVDYLPNYMHWQTKRPMKSLKGTIEKYKKYRKFAAFRRDFMPMTKKTFYSRQALQKLATPSALIVGSDQVWNPNLHGESKDKNTGKSSFDMTYLFDFDLPVVHSSEHLNEQSTAAGVKKIAYAASAGSVRFKDVVDPNIKQAVSAFDAIGCRERILEEDVNSLFTKQTPKTQTVLDPSLLLRDYSELEVQGLAPKQEYVVSYVVGSGEMLETFDKRVAEVKQLFGLPVIHLGAKGITSADQNILDIGPREWLTYIKNAKYVITNSFHGCAFSLNFNRQFLLVPHKLTELNQRQKTLLEGVELTERLLQDGEAIDASNFTPIDYNTVNPKLDELIKQSQDFLLGSVRQ